MSAHCPPQEQLERLLDDRLETIEDSAVAQHVESCAQCQAQLEQLLAGNLSSLGSAQNNPEMSDAVLNRLKKRGRRDDETDEFKGEQPLANGAALPEVPGYEVLSEIGRGGMGVIYKARHLRLGRVVALKMILAGAHARSDELRRFRIEASAVARLAHPGIVGVYDVGEHEGLPYLSLELVEGGSLKQLLAGTPQPPRESARLLEQLARAIQHAHDAGIVHRDLKPANVLLSFSRDAESSERSAPAYTSERRDGNEGANALRSEDSASRLNKAPLGLCENPSSFSPKITDFGLAKLLTGGPSDGPTQSGDVVGTPGYMAPEQAAGNQRQVGPAVDVYALGAILYECLTGRPPFQAPTTLETLLQVKHDEPVSIGRLQPRVPRDLATIAMRCLEKQPIKRYSSASDLADDLGRFLAGRPILARRVGSLERGWRWCKRNPVVAGLLALVFLVLLGGIAVSTSFGLEAQKRAGEAEEARDEADVRRQEAEGSAEAEKQARQREAAQRARAEKASDRTRQVLDAMVSGVTGDSLSTQKAITEEQKKFLRGVLSYYQEFAGEKADDEKSRARTAKAALRVGAIEYRLGRTEEGAAAFRMARDGYEKLTADFPAAAEYRRDLAISHSSLGLVLEDLGKRAEAAEQYQKGLAIQEKLATDFPAVADYRQFLAISHNNLGTLLAGLGKRAEAEQHYQKGLAIREKLAADFPAVPESRRDLAQSHNNLGALLAGLGKRAEAAEQYQKGLAIREKLAADFPAVPDYRLHLAGSHNNLGALLAGLGERAEAQEQSQKGLAILEKLAADFPTVPNYRQDLAISHTNLGNLLVGLGKRAQAEQQYQKGLAIREKLAADFPAVPEYRQYLAQSHTNLGLLLARLGKRAEAAQQSQKGLAIYEKLAADFPAVPDYQVELGASYCNLGNLVRNGAKPADSLAWFQKAIATLQPVHEKEPRAVTARRVLRNSHAGRAQAHDRLGKHADAVQDWDRAVELSNKAEQPVVRASRAASKVRAGQVAEALAEVAELTKSPRWNAGAWYDFACVYAVASGKVVDKKRSYADRAMALLHKAVKAGYKDAAHMKADTDLDALRERDDFKKLLAELAKPTEPKQ